MSIVTLDRLSEYLKAGATLDDVSSMIEMLRSYEEGIKTGIELWREYLPSIWDYKGNNDPHKQFKKIVIWLRRLGYVLSYPQKFNGTNCIWIKDDGKNCFWVVSKGGDHGRLYWTADDRRFSMEGLPQPEESPNDANRMPEFLTWA